MGDFDTLFSSLDADPRKRGRQFEHVCKWFLATDPVYSHELRGVWLWEEWPGRWAADAGIDLVAEDRNGELWAIQAKAYDPKYRVSKRDVDKFLSESGRAVFSYRMLIATTDLINRTGERVIQDQEKRVTFFRLNDLRAADVDWPDLPARLRPARRPAPARPRKHQREGIRNVVNGFRTTDRGQLIMACGTGKTLTGLFVGEKLEAKRTLVLVPSLSLLKQTLNVWRANCTTEFASLPVCSDETVGAAEEDAAVAHTTDIGVPVTTDPEKIAEFMRQRSGPRVVFATYQSSPQIAKAFKLGRVPGFDLIIADEAHRVAGKVSSDFGTVLDPAKIRGDRRLFMTATPRIYSAATKKSAEADNWELASMDDPARFGPVLHRLSFGEAIRRELLTDYQVAVVCVDDVTYRDWAQRGVFVSTDGEEVVSAATLAGQIGLAKAIRKYDLRRLISFHSRIKRAQEFSDSLPEVISWMPSRQRPKGVLWSRHVSGEMPAGDRYVLLQHLGRLEDADRGLLTNARCLAEGVDVPTLDGVAFIDPRRSEVDIVQAVGRAIRKSETKSIGTIVIPVFVDTDEDPEVALDSSVFKPVWDVVRALRSHDEKLGRQLDALRRELGRKGGRPRLPGKLHIDIPTTVGVDFARAFDVRLVEQTTLSWQFWYGLVQKYADERGTSRVPFAYESRGRRVGQWVNTQRNAYVAGVLSAERQEVLESLPDWTWNARLELWEDGYAALCRYAEEHGDAKVPYSFVTKDGFRLGGWVVVQRRAYNVGKLDPERKSRLTRLPGWTWDVTDELWEEGFSRLAAYVAVNGNALVPVKYIDESGYRLGQWVLNQRTFGRRGSLDGDRRTRLSALPGWVWHTKEASWEKSFRLLEKYVQQHGTAVVPIAYEVGVRLGSWCVVQRAAASRGQLSGDRYQRLDALPGWAWNTFDARWENAFEKLLTYVQREDTSLVPQSHREDGYSLGGWVSLQRSRKLAGKLSKEKQHRLEELPGWVWDINEGNWEQAFTLLLRYAGENGTAAVPGNLVYGEYKLGDWVDRQRSAYAKGRLDAERLRRLEALEDWQWTPKADRWEIGYAELLNYVAEHGNALVPGSYKSGGYRLGGWVQTQRLAHDEGTMTPDRAKRLEEIAGWSWDPHADSWDRALGRAEKYVAEYGNARIPDDYESEGFKLGAWTVAQRMRQKKGTLADDRKSRLDGLKGWVWDFREAAWEEGLDKVLEYVAEHGNARVSDRFISRGFQLGAWVTRQRSEYLKGKLDPARQQRLEEVPGWSWDPMDDSWEMYFGLLQKYVTRTGSARVPAPHNEGGFALGSWVRKQRKKHETGTLTRDRAKRLAALSGWTWAPPRGPAPKR